MLSDLANHFENYFDTLYSNFTTMHHVWQEAPGTIDYDILTGGLCIYSVERAAQIAEGVAQNIYTARHNPLENGVDQLDDMTVPLIDSVNRYWDPGRESDLWARIIPNQYPVVSLEREGHAPGVQDLFIAKPFDRNFADFTTEETLASLMLIAQHYNRLIDNQNIREVDVFQNWGDTSEKSRESAGATQAHPHVQIWGFPFITPRQHRQMEIRNFWSLRRKDKEQSITDITIDVARKRNTIIYENEFFIVCAAPAPKTNYTVRILATNMEAFDDAFRFKEPHPNRFGDHDTISAMAVLPEYAEYLALAFNAAMKAIKYALKDPAYNLIVHTLHFGIEEKMSSIEPQRSLPPFPTDLSRNKFFIDVHPRIRSVKAGMELLTDIDAIGVTPEIAAEALRSAL